MISSENLLFVYWQIKHYSRHVTLYVETRVQNEFQSFKENREQVKIWPITSCLKVPEKPFKSAFLIVCV